MSQSRFEWKVGIFVLVCLALFAVLVVMFNKGLSFTPTYTLRLKTTNVGLLLPKASVLMAGVRVGTVNSVSLNPDGKTVTIELKILRRYSIHSDARFIIDQIGFLGDQFVAIAPQANRAPFLKDGDEVVCEEPFNLQEVARSAMSLIQRVDQTAQKLNDAVARVDQVLLAEQTLTNLTAAIANFRQVSEQTLAMVAGINGVIQSNAPPVSSAVSNLVLFSSEFHTVASDLNALLATNRPGVTVAIKNVETATASFNEMLADMKAGKGLAGFLLKDEQFKEQTAVIMSNLNTLSSNLNKYGLLYKPRPAKSKTDGPAPYSGRKP